MKACDETLPGTGRELAVCDVLEIRRHFFKEIVSVKCPVIIKLISNKKYPLSLVIRRSLVILAKASLSIGAKANCNVLIESTSLRWFVNIK